MSSSASPIVGYRFPSSARIVAWLSIAISPLGAALAFALQPVMGKLMLPRLGGTSATWLGTALFFQLSLFIGYAWGLWLARRPLCIQVIAVIALAVAACVTFHTPESFAGRPTIVGVVLTLSGACLPAMVLLFSLSPWLHSWRERLELSEPYALYALSNSGSLLALLLYPFAIEPFFGIGDQLLLWRRLLFLAGSVLAAGAILLWQSEKKNGNPAVRSARERTVSISLLSWAVWIVLGALSCAVMLAATQLIADEIGSVPIAWVGPLGVYLAGLLLIFSGRWQPWMTGVSVVGLALSLACFMTLKGFGASTVEGACLLALVANCGFACLVGNALLHASRPARGGEWFYLALATGGVLGAFASIWIVPSLFSRPVEFAIGSAVLLAAGLFWGARWRHAGGAAACVALALGPVLILGSRQSSEDNMGDGYVEHHRDVYGHLMIKTDARSVVLSSATTTHGTQITEPPEARLRPTLYYTESSAVGRAIRRLQASRPVLRIAVIGLGAGTLASYTRPEDELTFLDIDPKIEVVARKNFSFLADARGQIHVTVADGRRALAEATTDYDLIVIDALMGDGIPTHLFTREALEIYQSRLKARDGLLVINSMLRYNRIYPFVAATARLLHMESLEVTTDIAEARDNSDWDARRTSYILVGSPAQAQNWAAWYPIEEDGARVKRELTRLTSFIAGPRSIWTDDRSAALDTLDLASWLSP